MKALGDRNKSIDSRQPMRDSAIKGEDQDFTSVLESTDELKPSQQNIKPIRIKRRGADVKMHSQNQSRILSKLPVPESSRGFKTPIREQRKVSFTSVTHLENNCSTNEKSLLQSNA